MSFWWFTAAGLQALPKITESCGESSRQFWIEALSDFKTAEEKCKSQLWVKLKGSRSRDWQINLQKWQEQWEKLAVLPQGWGKCLKLQTLTSMMPHSSFIDFQSNHDKDTKGIDSSFEKASWRIRYWELWKNTLYPLIRWRKHQLQEEEELQTGEVPSGSRCTHCLNLSSLICQRRRWRIQPSLKAQIQNPQLEEELKQQKAAACFEVVQTPPSTSSPFVGERVN